MLPDWAIIPPFWTAPARHRTAAVSQKTTTALDGLGRAKIEMQITREALAEPPTAGDSTRQDGVERRTMIRLLPPATAQLLGSSLITITVAVIILRGT